MGEWIKSERSFEVRRSHLEMNLGEMAEESIELRKERDGWIVMDRRL